MSEIMAIAGSTWRAVLRLKVVYFLILCVWILTASALNYDILSLDCERTLLLDTSLLLNQIAAMLVVISVAFEIPRELREGIASALLTKSLGRTQYVLGKMIGNLITGLVICGLIAVGSILIYRISFSEQLPFSFIQAQGMILAGLIPMSAIGVFCAVILPEMLAPIATLLIVWLSYNTSVIRIPVLSGGLLPNLDFFNFKGIAVYNVIIGWNYIAMTIAWGVAYAVFALMLASIIFRFRDIK